MGITTKDLLKLIRACRASNVSEIEVEGIKVKFAPGDAEQTSLRTGDAAKAPDQQELAVSEELARVQTIVHNAEEELAQMAIDDPVQYEELLIQRELEERDSGSDVDGDEQFE